MTAIPSKAEAREFFRAQRLQGAWSEGWDDRTRCRSIRFLGRTSYVGDERIEDDQGEAFAAVADLRWIHVEFRARVIAGLYQGGFEHLIPRQYRMAPEAAVAEEFAPA